MSETAYVLTHSGPIPVEKRTVGDVLHDINLRLEASGIEFGEYPFSDMTKWDDNDNLWPTTATWITAHAVVGGSEGYYIHIAALWRAKTLREKPEWRMLGLAKTWTVPSALEIVNAATKLLFDMRC